MLEDYDHHDALGLHEFVNRGEISPRELLETAISVAEAKNPELNAIVTPMFDQALASIDEGLTGPIKGVPFLIKDLTPVSGVRCTFGSRLWKDFTPDFDAEIVSRYQRAGLVIIGKTNTPELGLAATTEGVHLGACRNPWDTTRTTGGSSGGAAAAVAAGIVPAAHATDGGGSIRIPASCCGLVGLKPTRARTPLGPTVSEGWGSMASGHVVSRSVRDSAALLDVTQGPGPGDPYYAPPLDMKLVDAVKRPPAPLRIVIDLEAINGGAVHPACRQGVLNAAALCESLGHRVVADQLEYDREATVQATGSLVAANVRYTVLTRCRELGIEPGEDLLEAQTLRTVAWGASITSEDYVGAIHRIHRTGRQLAAAFQDCDVILSPTLLQPPPALGYMDTMGDGATYAEHFNAFWGFTNLYNATGNPAISLPLHWTPAGLPVGIQFAGAMGNEALLLQLAAQLEAAAPWFDRRPR